MFIHLGEEIVIRSEDVITIMDGQLIESASIMHEFIEGQREKNNIIEITPGFVKSVVITTHYVYFSPLAPATLNRRSQIISELDNITE